jgi:hypothetical protein
MATRTVSSGDGPALVGARAAFFPLYPASIRVVHAVTGMSWDRAGIAAVMAVAAVAAVLIHRLGTALYTPAAGLLLVVLTFTQPLSIVFAMAYSEALFLALAAGTHSRSWLRLCPRW